MLFMTQQVTHIMISEISSGWAQAIVALAALTCTLLLALIAAVWRIGTKMGSMIQTQEDHDERLVRIERHQDEHDAWHMRKGIV